jgi:hypothetical protein
MISFLTCNAKAVLRLVIEVSYQRSDKIAKQTFEVGSDTIYKITVADNMTGLRTYVCRITGYTMCTTEEVLSFVNQNTQPTVVDTLKIDYSEDNVSRTTSINVGDIRYIEELSTSGFDDIVNREVPTFK